MERVGVVGPDLDCWRAGPQALGSSRLMLDFYSVGLQALGVALLCKNNKEGGGGGGQRGLRPWPLRCLSQFLSERKENLFRGRMCYVCLRTFH